MLFYLADPFERRLARPLGRYCNLINVLPAINIFLIFRTFEVTKGVRCGKRKLHVAMNRKKKKNGERAFLYMRYLSVFKNRKFVL